MFSFIWIVIYVVVIVIGLLWIKHLFENYFLWKIRKNPPVITGIVPFVGAAIKFGKGPPVDYIKNLKETHGNTFTIHLAGRKMTFLYDPRDFELFFDKNEEKIDFQYATQPFLTKGFTVDKNVYFNHHTDMLKLVRMNLKKTDLEKYHSRRLFNLFSNYFNENWIDNEDFKNGSFSISLQKEIRDIVFYNSLSLLYGIDAKEYKNCVEDFKKFDDLFEIACSELPHLFLPSFTKVQSNLINICKDIINKNENSPLVTKMKNEMENQSIDSKAGFLFAMFWAAEANVIIAAFYVFAHLLDNPSYIKDIKEEIENVLNDEDRIIDTDENIDIENQYKFNDKYNNDEFITQNDYISINDLSKMSLLKHAVKESVRLHAPTIIVRSCLTDVTNSSGYVIPKGNFLCLSPLHVHRDDTIYQDGNKWMPERWSDESATFRNIRYSYLSFGANKYSCPGRIFAYYELELLVCLMIKYFDFTNISQDTKEEIKYELPDFNKMNLVGMAKPLNDIYLNVTKNDQ
eukprot:TRINITY_DN4753_c0_g1_i1.p1 TRINITY_DN4753_c0_g1~~TRINITY_DN4753_c0_g1_i1.p1  ORF type:complete len:515 (-),score=124.85 TRINITY_DN4753_c0_g1_i1:84-1628(-)